jgi:hypothetical protein
VCAFLEQEFELSLDYTFTLNGLAGRIERPKKLVEFAVQMLEDMGFLSKV